MYKFLGYTRYPLEFALYDFIDENSILAKAGYKSNKNILAKIYFMITNFFFRIGIIIGNIISNIKENCTFFKKCSKT